MIMLASLRSDRWTACPELVDDFIGLRTRLPGWDYTSAAHYFVTLCTKNQQCFFGDVVECMMHLSPIGELSLIHI